MNIFNNTLTLTYGQLFEYGLVLSVFVGFLLLHFSYKGED